MQTTGKVAKVSIRKTFHQQRFIASRGWYNPPKRKKIREKNGKCNQYDFLLALPKSAWETLKNNFRNFTSSLGLSSDHYWRGGIQEIHDFRGFWSISQRVCDISS